MVREEQRCLKQRDINNNSCLSRVSNALYTVNENCNPATLSVSDEVNVER